VSPTGGERRLLRLDTLLTRERELWASGVSRIAGVDEAGVGPLAGPIVAAAVIFPEGLGLPGVDDSKKLTPASRARLAANIRESALAYAVAVVNAEEIDRINPYRAALAAMGRALSALDLRPDHVLVDARRVPGCDWPQEAIIKGDARCHAIAAASILAKTTRDELMLRYDGEFPGYGFADHKGYGTVSHRDAIRRLGPCAIHRMSFTLLPPAKLWEEPL